MENKNNTSNTKLFEEFPPVSTQQWEDIIIKDLKGADYQKKLIWKTIEGFDVKPYYRAEDIKDLEHLNANPSEFPYTRGIKTDNNNWLIRADYCTSDIQNTNSHVLGAIEKGLDSVGFRVNNINTAEEMSLLLIGIDLTKTEINFLGARSYAKIIELFIEEIKRQNIDSSKVRGSLNFDSLSFALMHGDFHGDRKENFDEAVKIIKLIKENIPNFRAITINAQCMNNSGASNVQELGFALAIGNEYLSELTDRGLDIDTIASQIRFCFGVGSDYFMEIGKLRAARTLWAKIVEAYNPKHLESAYAFIHCITTSFNKSIFDPYVNMLRSTTESMSAAIGGCDSLTVNPFDSTYKRSDCFSRRISRNTQILIKGETFLDKVVDPAAGSYYIESLTDSIASYAWKLFQNVESKGGFTEALKADFIQNEIEATLQKRNNMIATRRQIILGTNQYPNIQEKMLDKIDKNKCCNCTDDKNTTFKKLTNVRGAKEFEKLRLATEEYIIKGGKQPKVFLLTIGNLNMRIARAMFMANFFGCAGYEIINNNGFKTVEEGIDAAMNAEADIIAICSSDEEYAVYAPAMAKYAKDKNAKGILVVAGNPAELIDSLKEAGISDFISVKTNVLESLKQYNSKLLVLG